MITIQDPESQPHMPEDIGLDRYRYGCICDQCMDARHPQPMRWPHQITYTGRADYRCGLCGATWYCSWNLRGEWDAEETEFWLEDAA